MPESPIPATSVSAGPHFSGTGGWTESGINWTNAPVIGGTALATLGLVNLGTWVDVTLPVSVFTAGNGTYSLAIRGNPQGAAWYSSREGVGAPQLVLR